MSELPFSNVRFSKHALEQMQRRAISHSEVMRIINHPLKTAVQTNGRVRYLGLQRTSHVTIVVIENSKSFNGIEIVTVFFSSKISKYLS